jgi:hypothetical protein
VSFDSKEGSDSGGLAVEDLKKDHYLNTVEEKGFDEDHGVPLAAWSIIQEPPFLPSWVSTKLHFCHRGHSSPLQLAGDDDARRKWRMSFHHRQQSLERFELT